MGLVHSNVLASSRSLFRIRAAMLVTAAFALVLAACAQGSTASGGAPFDDQPITSQRSFDAETYYAQLEDCVTQIREVTDFKPDIAIVLGSGLGGFVDSMDIVATIPYEEIDGFPQSTVEGHSGNLVFGTLGGENLVVMQGRVHLYEGYDVHDVVLPLRVLHMLGADTVILTNAVGSLNPEYRTGTFVVAEDQISDFVPSPLVGENISELGERFPSMNGAFDEELRDLVLAKGEELDITVHSGVFLQVTGPQYETPAEIKMFRSLGADTIGMSTAVEVIAARHMEMRVCSIGCVTNMASGMEEEELNHESVMEESDALTDHLIALLTSVIENMN